MLRAGCRAKGRVGGGLCGSSKEKRPATLVLTPFREGGHTPTPAARRPRKQNENVATVSSSLEEGRHEGEKVVRRTSIVLWPVTPDAAPAEVI